MLIGLLFGAALAGPPAHLAAQAILQIEAQRLPPLALNDFIADEDPAIRARAARGLGRLRTAAALAPLRQLIDDPDPHVRREAAFALGQTPGGGQIAEDRLPKETDHEVKAALLEAMGKLGGASAVAVVFDALDTRAPLLDSPKMSTAAARALGRMARRDVDGVGAPEVLRGLLRQMDRLDAELRRSAAYALAQIRPVKPPWDIAQDIVDRLENSNDPDVRKHLLYASVDLGLDDLQRSALYTPLLRDPDPGVRIALARVGGLLDWPDVTELLDDPSITVKQEAIAAVGKLNDVDHGALLLPLLQQGSDLEAAEALRSEDDPRLLLAVAALHALGNSPVAGVPRLLNNSDAYLQAARPLQIRIVAAGLSKDITRLKSIALEDGELPVRTAAAARVTQLNPSFNDVIELLGAFDLMVAAIAADWIADHPTSRAEDALLTVMESADELDILIEGAEALTALYEGRYPRIRRPDPRARVIARSLLGHPDRAVYRAAAPLARALRIRPASPVHKLISAPLAEVETIRQARIQTARGEAVITLHPEDAPITVWNFATLAEAGFYDGLSVHRVVPDFVVQDGDPRGDGTGGPGWSIPDEINPIPYATGTLGMAHAGPDTGGSQWFVTLSPQPHLDGVHTVFGTVTRGMHVFRDIQPGDRVEKIIIERFPDRMY